MFSFYFFVEESGRIETSRAVSTAIVKVSNNLLNKYYKPSEIIPSMGCFQEPESVSMQMQENMHFLITFAMAIGMAPIPELIFYAHCCACILHKNSVRKLLQSIFTYLDKGIDSRIFTIFSYGYGSYSRIFIVSYYGYGIYHHSSGYVWNSHYSLVNIKYVNQALY